MDLPYNHRNIFTRAFLNICICFGERALKKFEKSEILQNTYKILKNLYFFLCSATYGYLSVMSMKFPKLSANIFETSSLFIILSAKFVYLHNMGGFNTILSLDIVQTLRIEKKMLA